MFINSQKTMIHMKLNLIHWKGIKMKFIAMFKIVSFVSDLISHLIVALMNSTPLTAQDMDNCCDKCLHHKCDNNTNVNTDGTSDDSENTKFETSDDIKDKDKEDNNNDSGKAYNHPSPVINNYYCYDHRVYNIYKLHEKQHESSGLGVVEAIRILNWKCIFIALVLIVGLTAILVHLNADMLSWFVFHKVFAYLFNNHLVVVRSDVPV